jgi:hypothetical protein
MKTLFATITRQTEKAILVDFEDGRNYYYNVWLPKSQIKIELDPNASENGIGCGQISIPTWLLKKQKVAKVDRSDANSVWVSIFQKQDANGLTVNGYAL